MDNLHDNNDTNNYVDFKPLIRPDWMTEEEWQELQHISAAYNFFD